MNMYKDQTKAYIQSNEEYDNIYSESIKDSDMFWDRIADRITWYRKWNKTSDVDFTKAKIRWFEGGKLNASYNCLDRHIEEGHGDKIALIWEGNNPDEDKKYTYSQLLHEVSKFSNILKSLGIKKGDRVCI